MKTPIRTYVTVCVSALAAGGVFAFNLPWFVLPAALAVFFKAITSSSNPRTLGHVLSQTGLFFALYHTIVLSWFLEADITMLAGLDASQSSLIQGLSLLIMVAVLTLASLPIGFVLYKLQGRLGRPDFLAMTILASAWLVVEWLRSLVFSLFLAAPEASIGDYWNFGSFGLGIVSSPLGYLSRFIGMYGLSVVVITLSIAICWALKKRYLPLVAVLVLATLGSFASDKLWASPDTQTFEARLLQRESQLDDLSDGVPIRNKSESPKDLVVLPEYSDLYAKRHESFTERYVTNQLSDSGVVLDVTADFENSEPRYSYLLARDKEKIVDSQTKRLLIPTGEYLPSILKNFYTATGQTEIIEDFARTRKLERGDFPHIVSTENFKIAPVACSGILGRNIYRQLVNDGGEVLTNSASLSTFGGSKSYFRQSVQMARFHAVANNRTFIQATIGAPGFVIDNNGHFILEPDGSATEFADFSFTSNDEKTFYTKYGDWPLHLSGIVVALFAASSLRKNVKSRRKT